MKDGPGAVGYLKPIHGCSECVAVYPISTNLSAFNGRLLACTTSLTGFYLVVIQCNSVRDGPGADGDLEPVVWFVVYCDYQCRLATSSNPGHVTQYGLAQITARGSLR